MTKTALPFIFKLFFLCSAFFIYSIFNSQSITSQPNVTVELGVNDTSLKVTGKAFPRAFVTIFDSGSVIGTTSADSSGRFQKIFTSQTPGLHNLKLVARHTSTNSLTDTVTQNINLQSHSQTSIDFFLPPIVEISRHRITQGENLTIKGHTIPGGIVRLLIKGASHQAVADSNGQWRINIDSTNLPLGNHSLYALTQDKNGLQSYSSQKRSFIIDPASTDGLTSIDSAPSGISPITNAIEIPVILTPQHNQHLYESPAQIRGKARPDSQIELYDNLSLIASTWADRNGDWTVRIDLTQNRYDLKARSCIKTECSNFSKTHTVFYSGRALYESLKIGLHQYRFADINPGEYILLDLFVEGGAPPYEIEIDWGDGNKQTANLDSRNNPPRFYHSYRSTGNFSGLVTVRDSTRLSRHLSFTAEVHQPLLNKWTLSLIVIASSIMMIKFVMMLRR